MSMNFTMTVAGLLVHVEPLHRQVRDLCSDYIIDGDDSIGDIASDEAGVTNTGAASGTGSSTLPELTIAVTDDMIAHEREISGTEGQWSDSYLETLAVFRAIGEQAPMVDRMIFHGASIAYRPEGFRDSQTTLATSSVDSQINGRGFIFTAPSGTGKTTHIRLWRQRFGNAVRVINGDKPILELPERSDRVIIHANPWSGKEHWQTPHALAPLHGICVVTRGSENLCHRIDAAEALPLLVRQTYMPIDPLAASVTLGLLDRLLKRVPIYMLSCTISQDAVDASYSAMVGEC